MSITVGVLLVASVGARLVIRVLELVATARDRKEEERRRALEELTQ